MREDILKGVVYDRGKATLNGETRYMTLVALIIASETPLVVDGVPEHVIMGTANISKEIDKVTKYKCPYKFGDIGNSIIDISTLSPDDLEQFSC